MRSEAETNVAPFVDGRLLAASSGEENIIIVLEREIEQAEHLSDAEIVWFRSVRYFFASELVRRMAFEKDIQDVIPFMDYSNVLVELVNFRTGCTLFNISNSGDTLVQA